MSILFQSGLVSASQDEHVNTMASCGQHLCPLSHLWAMQSATCGMDASKWYASCWHTWATTTHKHDWHVSVQRLTHMHRLGALMWCHLWVQRHGDWENVNGMPWTKEPHCNRNDHNLNSKGLDVWAQYTQMQQYESCAGRFE